MTNNIRPADINDFEAVRGYSRSAVVTLQSGVNNDKNLRMPYLEFADGTRKYPSGNRKQEIIVFAGPNGSEKITITSMSKVIEPYINADEIKKTTHCSDMEAALSAEKCAKSAWIK